MITAHSIIKNEENFIRQSILSVIYYVDKVIIFDTGSEDNTIHIVEDLIKKFPDKIIFQQKGACDKKRHSELRQEMLEMTNTEWFMILDGDEVWTNRGMREVKSVIENTEKDSFIAPFYLCVGDIYHQHKAKGQYNIFGLIDNHTPRVFRNKNIKWSGDYGSDSLVTLSGEPIIEEKTGFLVSKFWHLTHLQRSSIQNDYSSGGQRYEKILNTTFLIGKEIDETPPVEFFGHKKIGFIESLFNFVLISFRKLIQKI